MLSRFTETRIEHALVDHRLSEELIARLEVSKAPQTAEQAKAILSILEPSKNKALENQLVYLVGPDGHKDVVKKVNGMVEVLEAKANGEDLTAAKERMGSNKLDKATKNYVSHTLASQKAAEQFKNHYNNMINIIQGME